MITKCSFLLNYFFSIKGRKFNRQSGRPTSIHSAFQYLLIVLCEILLRNGFNDSFSSESEEELNSRSGDLVSPRREDSGSQDPRLCQTQSTDANPLNRPH